MWHIIFLSLFIVAGVAHADYVTVNDTTTLITAINTANSNSEDDVIDLGGNTITFGIGTVTGNNALPMILADNNHELTLKNGHIIVSGVSARIIEIGDSANLSLIDMWLSGGNIEDNGGAIYINANGNMPSIINSLFSDNSAINGGVIYSYGTINYIINSTFANNEASNNGGAIYMTPSLDNEESDYIAIMGIYNTTIANNSSGNVTGGLLIDSPGQLRELRSSIIAGNTSDDNCYDINIQAFFNFTSDFSESNNLIGNNYYNGINPCAIDIDYGTPNANFSYVGSNPSSPIPSGLNPLADNGGIHNTMSLQPDSLAVDGGINLWGLSYDERGYAFLRSSGAPDIGAFELQYCIDLDEDSICDQVDNCPKDANLDQLDSDEDGVGDVCDNCIDDYNPFQDDFDHDGIGDVCDECTDIDGDGRGNPNFLANTCVLDNCPYIANGPLFADSDNDNIGDMCDVCPDGINTADADSDGVCDALDRCPNANDGLDSDSDGIPNACDNCPNTINTNQADFDNDGIGDVCDTCTDIDGDGAGDPGYIITGCSIPTGVMATVFDNCPFDANEDQLDSDGDGIGDACDACPDGDNSLDADSDGVCDALDRCPNANDGLDSDSDGIPNACDNCPNTINTNQADFDNDGIGDVCDTCTDIDGDGAGDAGYPFNTCVLDNCPFDANEDQLDSDEDGIGDACDICPDGDNSLDADSDGVCDAMDRCPNANDGDDIDGDGIPDECDNCPEDSNNDQLDSNSDEIGDACQIPPPPPPPFLPPPPFSPSSIDHPRSINDINETDLPIAPAISSKPKNIAKDDIEVVVKMPENDRYKNIEEAPQYDEDLEDEEDISSGCSTHHSHNTLMLLMLLILGKCYRRRSLS